MPDRAEPTGDIAAREVNRRLAEEVKPEMGRTTKRMSPAFEGDPRDCAFRASPEADPFGRDAHEPGAKLDAGKLRAGLVLGDFARALIAVSAVGTHGARKYTASGWCEVPDGHARYTDALMRHLLAEMGGEEFDPDSGLRHSAHAAWNALARLELEIRTARRGEEP